MMAFNFKLPCAVTCSIISFRGVKGKAKTTTMNEGTIPKVKSITLLFLCFFFLAPPTCQSLSLLIGLLEPKHTPGFYCHLGKTQHTSKGLKTFQLLLDSVASCTENIYNHRSIMLLVILISLWWFYMSNIIGLRRAASSTVYHAGEKNTRLDTLIGRNTCLIITFLLALHAEIM